MAADTIRSINAILQSGERKEQRKVDTALAMMQLAASQDASKERQILAQQQFAQQKRMQDIALVQSNLSVAGKQLEMEKPKIASSFLQSTGIGGIYQAAEEGDTAEDAITEMADNLRKRMGKGYDAQANRIAGAVFNYYSAKDSDSMINIASNLYDAVDAINSKTATKPQQKLFEAFNKLGVGADLQGIVTLAKKAKISEQRISKEMGEFLQGEYDIQDPIGIYSDIPEAVMTPTPTPTPLPPRENEISINETRKTLELVRLKHKTLESKVTNGIATDEEKEEYYELPSAIKRLRIDLYDATGEFEVEMDKKISDTEEKVDAYRDAGLSGLADFVKLKQKLVEEKMARNKALNAMRIEQSTEQYEDQLEATSELTGVSVEDIKKYKDIREKGRRSTSGRFQ